MTSSGVGSTVGSTGYSVGLDSQPSSPLISIVPPQPAVMTWRSWILPLILITVIGYDWHWDWTFLSERMKYESNLNSASQSLSDFLRHPHYSFNASTSANPIFVEVLGSLSLSSDLITDLCVALCPILVWMPYNNLISCSI